MTKNFDRVKTALFLRFLLFLPGPIVELALWIMSSIECVSVEGKPLWLRIVECIFIFYNVASIAWRRGLRRAAVINTNFQIFFMPIIFCLFLGISLAQISCGLYCKNLITV